MARNRVAVPAVGRHLTLDAGIGLDHDGHAPERAARTAAGGVGVLAGRGFQSLLFQHLLDRVVNPIVLVNPREVPTDDLRDRIPVLGVVAFELRDGHLEEVAVHGIGSGNFRRRRR
jgi:hypothetical protein